MGFNFTSYNTQLQAKLDGLTSSSLIDDFMIAGKAVEAVAGNVAVSDVLTAGTTQVTNIGIEATARLMAISTAGATQVSAVNSAGSTQVGSVNAAGDAKIAQIQAQGGSNAASTPFSPTGGIAATNVQAALAELDTEKQNKTVASNALDGLTPAADQLPYFTGGTTAGLTALTPFVRTLLDDTSATVFLNTLGVVLGAAAGNVPVLDGSGKLLASTLPALSISDTFPVASQAAMLALTAERGDVAVRSDINKSFILRVDGPSTLANWQELLTPTDQVISVAGLQGAILAPALKTALAIAAADIADSTTAGRALLTAANQAAQLTALGIAFGTTADFWAGDTTKFYTAAVFAAAQVMQTVTNATTANINFNAGINFKWTRTANSTLGTPTNMKEGWSGFIRLDGTGTLAFSSEWDIDGGTPSATAVAGNFDYLDYIVVNPAGGAKSIRGTFKKYA